jgi:hypothetical protein
MLGYFGPARFPSVVPVPHRLLSSWQWQQ